MARIRTIKPELPQSESMGRISRESRLCFILLWTLADDAGRLRGNSRMLASLLFPYDDDAKDLMPTWLNELSDEGCITCYQIGNDSYVQICNWLIHQKIDKPSQSKIPAPDESSRILSNPRESSSLDQGSRKGSEDHGREEKGSSPAKPSKNVYSPEFEEAWSAYPQRPGASKKSAHAAWQARIKAGELPDIILDGVRRYATYCLVQRTEPRFIKQPETFFGPAEHYKSDWTPSLPRQVNSQISLTDHNKAAVEEALRLAGQLP